MLDFSHGGNVYLFAEKLGCKPEDIIDLSSNISPFIDEIILKEAQSYLKFFKLLPSSHGYLLKKEVARRYGISLSQVVLGVGTSELIKNICFLYKNRKCLIFPPTYIDYEKYATIYSLDVNFYYQKEEDEFELHWEKIDFSKYEIVFICNPNNPTGKVIRKDELIKVVSLYPDTLFVVDESYLPFLMNEDEMTLLGMEYNNLLVLRSFSKIYGMAGIRLGFAYSKNTRLIKNIERYNLEWGISSISEQIGVKLLSIDTKKIAKQIDEIKCKSFERLMQIDGIKVYPSDTNFLLIKLLEKDSDYVVNELLKEKILVRNCKNIRGLNNTFIRISIKEKKKMDYFIKVFERILNG
ncbi:pyridoxal phosphate-dependent aminotransferase [Deferribacter abyssi]|uniref:pyridoxal phosphate-dependent aminotransferase n=1 Tax=Deferribacter abyssi TaxID=213806 RepID=UPI003C136AC7